MIRLGGLSDVPCGSDADGYPVTSRLQLLGSTAVRLLYASSWRSSAEQEAKREQHRGDGQQKLRVTNGSQRVIWRSR